MRMDWNKLINSKRLDSGNDSLATDFRTEFERDVDRIIFSSAFRRLQDKTQVFPIPKSDFIHSRLTHSIEVASVGRSLGKLAGNFIYKEEKQDINDGNNGLVHVSIDTFGEIVSAACLCHDIGNPPFGHSGEDAFRHFYEDFFEKNPIESFGGLTKSQIDDFLRFEGNAEGFKILTNDHPSGRSGGLRLTYSTLATFTKYPCESGKITLNQLGETVKKRRSSKKIGFFQSEKEIFEKIANEVGLLKLSDNELYFCRHPLAFLIEAADNISYQMMDIEDGHKLGLIKTDEVIELLTPFANSIEGDPCDIDELKLIKDECERVGAFRSKAITSLIQQAFRVFENKYDLIMQGKFDSELTDMITQRKEFEKIDEIKKKKLFNYYKVVAIESAGRHVIDGLLKLYLDAFMNIEKKYGQNLINMLPIQFRVKKGDDPYTVLLKISSYLSRMTDSFAIDQYRSFTGHKYPEIN